MGDLFDLSGHVALVTGGNSGLGLGFAEGLAAHGADVAIWGTNVERNAQAAEQLRRHGHRVLAQRCDVSEPEQVNAAMAETIATLGRVDSCFANAGVGGTGVAFVDMTPDDWHRVLRVNLDGCFYTLQAAVRHMVERGGGGSLVVTASGSIFMGQPRGQHYASSKAGIVAMAKAIAVEHARDGIRANAVLAGWTHSGLTEQVLKWDRFIEKVLPRVPLRRWGNPDDFSGIAVYLASDASRWHTGDLISIDGGYGIF